jgi:hypothetical protein
MKRVNNSDVNIKLNPKILDITNFTVKFFTVNAETFYITKTQDDVTASLQDNKVVYYIKLYWSELLTLGEGVLQYHIIGSTKHLERTTEYYINSNVIVDDESEKDYNEVIAELGARIDSEIQRSTSADTDHLQAINQEASTRQSQVSDILELLDVITGETPDMNNYYTKSETYNKTEVDSAISNIDVSGQLANYVPKTDFNTYSGGVNTNITSISGVVDTKLDSSAYTETDLSDYYTKSEVDAKVADGGTFDPTQYYTKSEVDTAISNVDVSDQLTGFVETSKFNTYSASTNSAINAKVNSADLADVAISGDYDDLDNKPTLFSGNYNDLSNKPTIPTVPTSNTAFTNDAGYLTEHQSLSNYYTKSEVDAKVADGGTFDPTQYYTKTDVDAAISGKVESADLANVATTGDYDDLTNKPTLFSGSYNDLTNKPTLFSGDYNDLDNKPTIPTVPTNVSDFTNDAGYLTQHQDISGKLNVSDFNSYSASTATAIGSKLDSTAYTPTDLTNYYTKSETSGATEISTALGNKQNTLVSGSNIKTINNTSILGSGNITIEGGSGSSGFIQVTNPTAETTVGLVNSLSEYYNTNIGNHAVIEGDGYSNNGTNYNIEASGRYSHAEGRSTKANGFASHAEGLNTTASAHSSHAEGQSTTASGESSHAEGKETTASGNYSHTEGYSTTASGQSSHAEGYNTQATNSYSHAEGNSTEAIGDGSHAEGSNTTASGNYSHAEGYNTQATNSYSHAEGASTKASGYYSHAEGADTKASDYYSHAEGCTTSATSQSSHAEGYYTIASGDFSHAEGYYTIAGNQSEHASGRYNVSSSASLTFGNSGNILFSVGNGTSTNARHNAFDIRQNGEIYYADTQLINTASTRYNSGFTYSNVPELCLQKQLEKFVSTEQLPTVAKTGSYEDLVNRPFGDFEEQVGESIYSNSGTLAQNGPSHYGFNGIELDTSNWTDGMTVNLILDDVLYGSGLITSGYSGAEIVYWINATPNGSPYNDTWSVFLNGSYYAISIYNVQGTHKVELVIDGGTQIVTHKLELKYLPIWHGSESDYNALTTKDNNTIYIIEDD